MSNDPASYVEDVPVKIPEKYRPPRKVNLPFACIHHVNTEVLTAEYNVTTEQETLKWLQNIKTHKENKLRLREEKIRQYEEEKKKKLEEEKKKKLEEEKIMKEKLEEEKQKKIEQEKQKKIEENEKKLQEENDKLEVEKEEEKCNLSEVVVDLESQEEIPVENEEQDKTMINEAKVSQIESGHNPTNNTSFPMEANAIPSYPSNPAAPATYSYPTNTQVPYLSVNSSQQPNYTPMLVPTQCSSQTFHQKSPTKSGYRPNINFAEFEGDASDPFDSVALKSINEMEELAKILQTSNVKQYKGDFGVNDTNFTYPQTGTYMNGGYQYPYVYPNYNQSTAPINTSLFNQISSYQAKAPSPSTTPSVPLASKNNAVFHQDAFSHPNYNQWNCIQGNRNTAVTESTNYKPYSYGLSQNSITGNIQTPINRRSSGAGSGFPAMQPSTQANTPLTSSGIQALDPGIESLSKRQDLEDFYTRYYSNKKTPSSKTRSGTSSPTICQQTPKATLSSSSSVPDLTAVGDSEIASIVYGNHVDFEKSPGNTLNRPRPSSTGGYEGIMNSMFRPKSPNAGLGHKVRLPDPFTELTEDAQALVQNMAEMGFPRPRVARAVQKLGTDHKKLLEVLLTLQGFQESGEDEIRSERAFYFFMGEVSKVKEFLHASKSLIDLGFDEERVVEGLFRHQNDKEKCLEELIN